MFKNKQLDLFSAAKDGGEMSKMWNDLECVFEHQEKEPASNSEHL